MRKCRLKSCRAELPSVKESSYWQKQNFCNVDHMAAHGLAKARQQQERAKKATAKKERAEHKEAKERVKTRSKWLQEAQQAFNAFIRARDENLPCICCGEWADGMDWVGGNWDAGHYLTRGAFPELRFEELNCHKQLKSCNAGSGKYARKGRTVQEGYRELLIEKIGQDAVDYLEGPHKAKKYTIDDLKAIRDEYRAKLKSLKQERAAA